MEGEKTFTMSVSPPHHSDPLVDEHVSDGALRCHRQNAVLLFVVPVKRGEGQLIWVRCSETSG